MDIAKRRLRQTDESGRLAEVGFSWFEPRLDLHELYGTIVDTSLHVGGWLVPAAMLLAVLESKWWFVAGPCCALAFLIVALAQLKTFTQPLDMVQGLTFDPQGRMRYIVAQYYRRTEADGKFQPEWAELRWTIDEISSIEMASEATVGGGHYKAKPYKEDEYFAYAVNLYFTNGELFRAARNLHQENARIVAVQLNRALTEIRSVGYATPRTEVA